MILRNDTFLLLPLNSIILIVLVQAVELDQLCY